MSDQGCNNQSISHPSWTYNGSYMTTPQRSCHAALPSAPPTAGCSRPPPHTLAHTCPAGTTSLLTAASPHPLPPRRHHVAPNGQHLTSKPGPGVPLPQYCWASAQCGGPCPHGRAGHVSCRRGGEGGSSPGPSESGRGGRCIIQHTGGGSTGGDQRVSSRKYGTWLQLSGVLVPCG